MTQALFIESDLHFEKVASETTLPEDPNQWPNEILQQLYKEVPYVADFEPQIIMDRVDAERGFGFGHVEVGNRTEALQPVSPDQADAAVPETQYPDSDCLALFHYDFFLVSAPL